MDTKIADTGSVHLQDGDWHLFADLLGADGELSQISICKGDDALDPFHGQCSWDGCPVGWQRVWAEYTASGASAMVEALIIVLAGRDSDVTDWFVRFARREPLLANCLMR